MFQLHWKIMNYVNYQFIVVHVIDFMFLFLFIYDGNGGGKRFRTTGSSDQYRLRVLYDYIGTEHSAYEVLTCSEYPRGVEAARYHTSITSKNNNNNYCHPNRGMFTIRTFVKSYFEEKIPIKQDDLKRFLNHNILKSND